MHPHTLYIHIHILFRGSFFSWFSFFNNVVLLILQVKELMGQIIYSGHMDFIDRYGGLLSDK